jgi:hypothetical protein
MTEFLFEDQNAQSPNLVIALAANSNPKNVLDRIVPRHSDGAYERMQDCLALYVNRKCKTVFMETGQSRDVILLGHMVSESCPPERALQTAISSIENERYEDLRQLQGIFALVIVYWEKQHVIVVSDLLGIKPFFVASNSGITVLADRAEVASHIVGPKVDPIGFGAWLYFGAPLADRTIFNSVNRMAPGTVTVIAPSGFHKYTYWSPIASENAIAPQQLMDELADEFSGSVSRLLAPHIKATILLSGGFDSRFALLTALQHAHCEIDAATVPYTDAERKVVDDLVSITGISCRKTSLTRSLWDEFDSMWFRHPDGFQVTKNLTYLCVMNHGFKGVFMDGSIASLSVWCHTADPENGPPASEQEARQFIWKAHANACPSYLFKKAVLRQLERSARQAVDEQSSILGWDSKFCLKWDMYQDERRFRPINFLQYANFVHSVHPFYDRALIERRLRHPNSLFNKDFYHEMLSRRFPGPGGLPHTSDLPRGKDTVYSFSHALHCQLPELILFLARNRHLFDIPWLLPRISTYGFGWRKYMYVVLQLTRLMKMEQELIRMAIAEDLSEFIFGLHDI